MEQRCLLAAFAHPDDEAFGTAGVFRKYRDEGVMTALVCATRGEAGEISDPALAARLAQAADPTPLIAAAALDPAAPDALSAATLETFVAILGAEAGNLALKVLATGGVYVAGGIPIHVAPLLEEGRFMRAFRRKGRFAELLSGVPVHLVATRAALIGAARYGFGLAPAGSPADV